MNIHYHLHKSILAIRNLTMALSSKSQSTQSTQIRICHHTQKSCGMTLIEMMIVVVILSVLTTLAVTGYRKLIYQARNAEAYHFLGAIRAAQAVYYQTYGQYAGSNGGFSYWPESYPVENRLNWGEPNADAITWQHLGVRPEGPVWFRYGIQASDNAADAPAAAFEPAPNGPWFQAQAKGDFNGDGNTSTFEITSEKSEIYVENANE